MIVTVTSIRLRHWWYFFRLSWQGLHISRQARSQAGFIKMKNTGSGLLHFTLTAWESEEAMRSFATSGAHLRSMKLGPALATELRTYTYRAETFPGWAEAKRDLLEKGKVMKYS